MAVGVKLSADDSDLFDEPTLYVSIIEPLDYLILIRLDIR